MRNCIRYSPFLFGLLLLSTCQQAMAQPSRVFSNNVDAVVSVYAGNSSGSGFVVTRDGLIATNEHVIRGGRNVMVQFGEGGDVYPAEIIRVERNSDLALLQINTGRSLQSVTLGSRQRLGIGDQVIAIGSPMGLDRTLSEGIVSQFRVLDDVTWLGELIQITTSISPGSSGGPLFDRQGRVVGITMLQSSVGQNLNFAVPVERLLEILRDRRATTRRGGRERTERGSSRSSARNETRDEAGEAEVSLLNLMFEAGLLEVTDSYRSSSDYAIVRRAQRAAERGNMERSLNAFLSASSRIEFSETYYFWGIIDALYSHPSLARKHLRDLDGYDILHEMLLEFIIQLE